MSAGLLLLVCAGAVLYSAEAQDPYTELPDYYKKGVNLTLEQLNSHVGVHHHFRFLRSLEKSDIESGFGTRYVFHNFYLKPTWCPKGTPTSSPQRCPFRNDRPLMDCAVCYKTAEDQIQTNPKPYLDCIQKPRLTEAMRTARIAHCKKMNYNSGAPTLLASKLPS
uniref:Retinoic acid receptor responder protein 2 n=1 Tax=Labrus bergylta TaxID=56723 RepID=A0A3Q3M8A8_9LABR